MHGEVEHPSGDRAGVNGLAEILDGLGDGDRDGYHHFLGIPTEGAFSGYGSRSKSDPNGTLQILFRLARVISLRRLKKDNVSVWENSARPGKKGGIPAGYTYLLQLAAHDLVHTSTPIVGLSGADRPVRNLRRIGLDLETLFGGGPTVCPFAYERVTSKTTPAEPVRFSQKPKLGATGKGRCRQSGATKAPG